MRTSSTSSEGSQRALVGEAVSPWSENREETFFLCIPGCLEETVTLQCYSSLEISSIFSETLLNSAPPRHWRLARARSDNSIQLQEESWKHATVFFCLKKRHSLSDLKPHRCTLQKGMLDGLSDTIDEFTSTICVCDLLLRSPTQRQFSSKSDPKCKIKQ